MDMGLFGKERKAAQELTKEIDQATGVEAQGEISGGQSETFAGQAQGGFVGGQGETVAGQGQIDSEMVQRIGGAALGAGFQMPRPGEMAGQELGVISSAGMVAPEMAPGVPIEMAAGMPMTEGMPANGGVTGEEQIKRMVAAENGYVQTGLAGGENVVGGESAKEVRGRLKDDHEDLEVETGVVPPEMKWQHELLTSSQKKLTSETVKQIDEIVKETSYRPWQLEKERFLGMNSILRTYGRTFGERN